MKLLTPGDVRERARKLWDRGRVLSAWAAGEPWEPVEFPVGIPSGAELTERFPEVRAAVQRLREDSQAVRGYGYRLEEEEIRHRQVGVHRLPRRAVIDTLPDFLRLTGKRQDFARFRALAEATRDRVPELEPYLRRQPLGVLGLADRWDAVLAVCAYFRDVPHPGCYVRQLDIPGVHTKFIEQHEALLHELLPLVAPEGTWGERPAGSHAFERRFGLRHEPMLVRFRVLDPALAIAGYRDLTVPLSDFARPPEGLRRVFIVENKVPGLCFPDMPDSWVVFGMGKAVQALAEAKWLREKELIYWGDLDTEGFRILARFREVFPHCRSLLMNEETLMAYRALWGQEPEARRNEADPVGLTDAERHVFEGLRTNRWGERVRLEQEAIRFGDITSALNAVGG